MRLALIFAGLTLAAVSDKCKVALDAFKNPSQKILESCNYVRPNFVPGLCRNSTSKEPSSNLSLLDPAQVYCEDDIIYYQEVWSKMCGRKCRENQNALYRNIYEACGTKFDIDIDDPKFDTIPATTAFQVNMLTRDLVCSRWRQEYCWLNNVMLARHLVDFGNYDSVCSRCAKQVYVESKYLSRNSTSQQRSIAYLMKDWLQMSKKLVDTQQNTCDAAWFRHLPEPKFSVSTARKISSGLIYAVVLVLVLLL